jgi:hypothetical protein
MMVAIHAQERNGDGRNSKPLRHSTGSSKVQVCCASQEKYGISQGACRFQRCMQFAEFDDGGDGSMCECVSE